MCLDILNNCEFFVTGKNIELKQCIISFWGELLILEKSLKISYSKRV